MTDRGVVTLPARLRKALALKPDEPLIAEVTAQGLLLRPAVTLPIEVYDAARLAEFESEEADLAKVLARKKRR